MDRTKVTCIDTGTTIGADILSRTDRRLEVAVDGTAFKLKLSKRTPSDKLYVGHMSALEFTSTGD